MDYHLNEKHDWSLNLWMWRENEVCYQVNTLGWLKKTQKIEIKRFNDMNWVRYDGLR